ncbi:RHS repeat protein, partial [bacterium]
MTRGQSAQGLTGVTVGAACIVQRSYYDGLGRVETQVRNLVGDYSLSTPPDRDLTPPYEHPDQNIRMDTVYDSRGNQTDIIDSQGIVTHFAYDGMDRLERVIENYRPGLIPTDQVNVTTLYTYDARGNRLSIESARAVLHPELQLGKTTFTYDALGRLLSERDPLNHGVEYTYNLLGQRVVQRDAAGLETQFVYDALGRVEKIDYPGTGMDVSFRYYPTGQYRTMADGVGTTTWQYDGLERIEQVSDPFQQVVAYGYDGLGNRTRLIYPDARQVQYDYNALGQLVRVTDWNQQLTEYIFNATGQLHTMRRPNAVTSTYTYNDAG